MFKFDQSLNLNILTKVTLFSVTWCLEKTLLSPDRQDCFRLTPGLLLQLTWLRLGVRIRFGIRIRIGRDSILEKV